MSKAWKGDFKEHIVQTGAYTYVVSDYGKDEQSVKKTGTVNVLR